MVRRLRELDMPIADIRSVLVADPDTRNELISTHLSRLEAELASTRAAVDALRNILDRPSAAAPIDHRTVPATRAIGIQQVVDRDDIRSGGRATRRAARDGRGPALRQTGVSGGLYASEIFQHDRGEATVFIPVDGSIRAVGRVVPFTVPPAELAVIRHHGSLDDVDLTYSELGAYATRHEISVDGPLREYYVATPATHPIRVAGRPTSAGRTFAGTGPPRRRRHEVSGSAIA